MLASGGSQVASPQNVLVLTFTLQSVSESLGSTSHAQQEGLMTSGSGHQFQWPTQQPAHNSWTGLGLNQTGKY